MTIRNSWKRIIAGALAYLGITGVEISSSVTTIGEYAFMRCAHMTSVTLPDCMTSIGSGALNSCNKLTTINIPANVTAIISMTFASCGLTSITIPAGITSIGNYAFLNCTSLTTVTLVKPSATSGLSVGSAAFKDCLATVAFSGSGTSTLYDGSTEITEVYAADEGEVCELKAETLPEGDASRLQAHILLQHGEAGNESENAPVHHGPCRRRGNYE